MTDNADRPKQNFLFSEIEDDVLMLAQFDLYKLLCKPITRMDSLELLEHLIRPTAVTNKKTSEISFKFPRQKKLIADFSSGYAKNWAFQIHGVFAKNLCILDKTLSKKELDSGTKPYKVQGGFFNFTANQMLYDTPLAYLSPWNECLKHIKYGLEIEKAIPVSISEETGKRDPGLVSGWIYINTGKGVKKNKPFSMTQDAFVRVLIDGFQEDLQ
jgi:hypothetical protein